MSEGSVKKAFKLQPVWDEHSAIAVNGILDEMVARQTVKKTGRYQGTGALQRIEVSELPNPPLLVVLQKDDGSAPYLTLLPMVTSSNVIAWAKGYFTLAAGSTFNAVGADYLYLVLA